VFQACAPILPAGRRRLDTRFQRVVERAVVGKAVVQDCRFDYVNPEHREIFGYRRSQLKKCAAARDLPTGVSRIIAAKNADIRGHGRRRPTRHQLRCHGRH
jgi:hypothetical protein